MKNENIDTPRIKVTRKRKRLYESDPDGVPQINKQVIPSLGKRPTKKTIYNFKHDEAGQIITSYTTLAAGSGLLPFPVVDILAIKTIGLKMIQSLCRLYGITFTHSRAKIILTDLTQGRNRLTWFGSLSKMIPFIGSAGGGLAVLYKGGQITHFIGITMTQHFESGGSLEDFDS